MKHEPRIRTCSRSDVKLWSFFFVGCHLPSPENMEIILFVFRQFETPMVGAADAWIHALNRWVRSTPMGSSTIKYRIVCKRAVERN